MYYYRRKTSPLKWIIIIFILIAIICFGYWFYINYFSKIEFPKQTENLNQPAEEFIKTLSATLSASEGDVQADLQNKGYEKVYYSCRILRRDGWYSLLCVSSS